MKYLYAVGLCALVLTSCRHGDENSRQVRSHLSGTITVSAEIDSTINYSGFEIIVARDGDLGIDTLGYALTDASGVYSIDVVSPDRGVFSVLIARRGQILGAGDLVVADGDSAILNLQLPLNGRTPRARSTENAAWMAFVNTKAQYNQGLIALVNEGQADLERVAGTIEQSFNLLWGLQETFPGTFGAELAAVEGLVLMEGWNDSLLVSRAESLDGTNPALLHAARTARRAQARLEGQASAIRLIEFFRDKAAHPEVRAGLQAELVQAYMDSLQQEEALAAVRALKRDHPRSEWSRWASLAEYEARYLLPGFRAPDLTSSTRQGEPFDLAQLKGKVVILEFMEPRSATYQRQLPEMNAFYDEFHGQGLELVTISLERDRELNDAFYEDRHVPGIHIHEARGADGETVKQYNVQVLPTRFLIDAEGNLAGKYVGEALPALLEAAEDQLTSRRSPRP